MSPETTKDEILTDRTGDAVDVGPEKNEKVEQEVPVYRSPRTLDELKKELHKDDYDADKYVSAEERQTYLDNISSSPALANLVDANEDDFDLVFECLSRKKYTSERLDDFLINFLARKQETQFNKKEQGDRLKSNPFADEREYVLGTYRESIERQVRSAVFDLLQKGYKPFESGFDDLVYGSQYIGLQKEGVDVSLLQTTLGKLARVDEGKDRITITFYPRAGSSIEELKSRWDSIASIIPAVQDADISALVDNRLQGVYFREKQDKLKKGENVWLGNGCAFVGGKIVEMTHDEFKTLLYNNVNIINSNMTNENPAVVDSTPVPVDPAEKASKLQDDKLLDSGRQLGAPVSPDSSGPGATDPNFVIVDRSTQNPDTALATTSGVVDSLDSSASPVQPELSPAEKMAELERNLVSARESCSRAEIDWKNNARKTRGFLAQKLDDLKGVTGFGSVKEPDKTPEYIAALDAYKLLKKQKAEATVPKIKVTRPKAGGNPGETEVVEVVDKVALFAQVEEEYIAYQKTINESLPPLEKGLARKALDTWLRQPKAVRVAAIPVLIGVGSFAVGAASLAGATGYVGWKVGKSALKSTASGYVSKKVGDKLSKRYEKANTKERQEMEAEFKGKIDLENFDDNSDAIIARLQNADKTKNRQRTKKVMAQVGLGVWMSGAMADAHDVYQHSLSHAEIGIGLNGHEINHDIELPHDGAHEALDTHSVTGEEGDSVFGSGGEPVAGTEFASPELPGEEIHSAVSVSDVELSSSGFIHDIDSLKHQVLSQYDNNMDNVPQGIKDNLFNKSSIDLAKQYGFYDPEHGLSGMGLKGEHLSVNDDGSLIYHDIGGNNRVVFDASSGEIHRFDEYGKMFTPKLHEVDHPNDVGHDYDPGQESGPPDDVNADDLPGHPVDLDHMRESVAPDMDSPTVESSIHLDDVPNYPDGHIPYGNTYVNIVEDPTGNKVVFDGYDIAHEGEVGAFGKSLVLDDKFQDGEQYADVRKAFITALGEKYGPMQMSSRTFGQIHGAANSAEFEGGRVYVLEGVDAKDPHSLGVYLNGKQIAHGVMTDNGPKMDLLKDHGIRSGLFRKDTVYERAFKVSKDVAKQMKSWTINNN